MKRELEKIIWPEETELIIKNGEISAEIIDAELDPIRCNFNNDDCIQLNTKDYVYITLTRENLCNLLDLLDESELKYKQINKKP